jgi:hypoxanthine-guanine phosphoribosyltransferase
MRKRNNGYFSYKYIPTYYRKYILKTMEENDFDDFLRYADKINDKNVLILDDTIATGSTISETTNLILKSYVPKNITIITLFSKL